MPRPREVVRVAHAPSESTSETTRKARKAAPAPSALPAMPADQLHETALAERLLVKALLVPADAHQRLRVFGADRHDESSADGELFGERPRQAGGRGGDEDRVVRCMLGPTDRSVADLDQDVVAAEALEPLASDRHEARDALDREHTLAELGEHRRLVARARADLESALGARKLEGLAHRRDHERLRDRLLLSDRQRLVEVSAIAQRLFDEEMARHLANRLEHARVADVSRADLGIEHLLTRALVVHGQSSSSRESSSQHPWFVRSR